METGAAVGATAEVRDVGLRARALQRGLLVFATPDVAVVAAGRAARVVGSGKPTAVVRLRTWKAALTYALRDQLGLFEAYVEGHADVEAVDDDDDDAAAFLAVHKVIDERSRDFAS